MPCGSCPGSGTRVAPCDVCGQVKPVQYCSICKAWICDGCRVNPFARIKAAIRREVGLQPQQPLPQESFIF